MAGHSFLQKLSRALGYTFRNIQLLEQALTHRSLKFTHNERLEFLGDSVLGLVITAALFKRHPNAAEGELSTMRASLVCEQTLVVLANQFQLADYIRVGASELGYQTKRRPALLADALEAIIGAIYLDGEWIECENCILSWYKNHLDQVQYIAPTKDAKTALQEYLQARGRALPRYELVSQTGTSHEPTFTIACQLPDIVGFSSTPCTGVGRNRREAEQQAATKTLALLLQDHEDYVSS
jgi:ribonuclease-3